MSTDIYYSGDDFTFDYQLKNADGSFIDLNDTVVTAELSINDKTIKRFQGIDVNLTTTVDSDTNIVVFHLSRELTAILPKSYRYQLKVKLKGSDDKQITWDVYDFQVR